MVGRICLCQPWILIRRCEVELTAIYDDTTDYSSVSTNELGCRVYNHISAILNWTNQAWSCEGIINYERNLMIMGDLRNCLDINHFRIWITKGLDEYQLGVLLECCIDLIEIVRINEGCCNSVINQGVL